MRNVGLINKIDTLKLKHRSYALAVPLAIKIGNTQTKWYVAPGAEAELMFNYKVKEFIRGKKVHKHSEWLSDEVNLFNPSVFLQINLGGATNVKFKYYLYDFLMPNVIANTDSVYTFRGGNLPRSTIPQYTRHSKLFYVSFGTTMATKKRFKKRDAPRVSPFRNRNRSRDV